MVSDSENERSRLCQAAFLLRLTLAHLARWAAAILRRADTDIVRLGFVIGTTFLFPLTLAQRALCAAAIRARPLADILLRGLVPLLPRCFIIPDKLANVVSPSGGDCNRGQ